ncbi:ribonuclease HI [Patescibacteria group bacterium]|nr:ribonuclease HI [Patescibacteria group bacterium]
MEIKVYTDGSSLGNPGQGGRGAIIMVDGKKKALSGGEPLTTNNRMELLAVIEVLKYFLIKNAPKDNIHFYVDSKYVKDGVERLKGWVQRGRRLMNKKPVANRDLREEMYVLLPSFTLQRHRVKGHAQDEINNKVDKLARSAAEKQPIIAMPVKEKHVIEKVRGQMGLFG